MSQSIVLDIKGLFTYPSDISGVPSGSLAVALNININRQGIGEPRRGFDLLAYGLPLTDDRTKKLVFWNDGIFVHYGSTFAYYNPASGISSRGSLTTPTSATSIRAVSSQNKNLYVTSSLGLKKTDAVGTSLYQAGVPKGLNIDLSVAGAGSALANSMYASYRYHLGRKDANSNAVVGGVSGAFTLQNLAGSTQNVTAKCYLPSGLDTTYYIRLYRTPGAASSATTGEEPQLCYETPISSTDVSNGYVTITDIVPDDMLGAYLYTNPSQQGLVNDNAVPPLSRDIAEYKSCMFYADVESPERLIFSLIAGGATSGLVAGDTITIVQGATTEIYTAHASVFNAATKQFIVTSSGGTSQAIDATVKSFIKCVDLSSAIVYAYSLSTGATDLPGKLLLESRSLGTASFTATSSSAVSFQPQLASPATVNNTSTADTFKHGLMYSKPGQPEAVPLKNVIKIGASDDRIKRIIALREALLIFKERDGVYVLRGEDERSFAVSLLDSTAKVTAPDSLVSVNNTVLGLFEAGLCEVTDTGVSIVSLPIKDQLLLLYGTPLAALKAYSFGMANDTDGKYVIAFPESSSATSCTKQLVFDTFGRTFCTWNLDLTCGGINPVDSKMYLGSGDSNKIKQERKAFDYTDYADFNQTCTVSAYSGTTVTINGTSTMARGDVIYQGNTALAYIESVDSVAGTIEIDSEQEWTLSTADVSHAKAIDCRIQWNPDVGGNAAGLKQYYECSLISKQIFQKEATLYFTSDTNPSEASIMIESASGNGAFGQFDFGQEVFGGEQAKSPKRIGIPGGHARCSQLSVRFENRVAFSDFQITGLSLSFNPTSTRIER